MAATQSNTYARAIDILIVGTGIAGTALASFLLLAQIKQAELAFRITVLERSPSIQGHGQNIDIRGPGKHILKKLGIDDDVKGATTGEKGARFVDSAGKAWASFGVDESGEIETPTGEIEILRGRLAQILFKRCRTLSEQVEQAGGTGVEFMFGESVEEIQQQARSEQEPGMTGDESKVRVRFRKSQTWRAFDVVVGADGLQSRTRALAWGIEQNKSDENSGGHSSKQAASSEEDLRRRKPFSNGVVEPISHLPRPSCPEPSPDDTPALASAVKDLQANADPFLKPLGVYAAFYSIPASLFANSDGDSSVADFKAANANDHLGYNDGWRRWYHAPGRRSVMLRPSDDKSRLTVLMIVLDVKHRDSRLHSVATVRSDRHRTVLEQKKLMREYFEDAGWECARLADGMDAADDFYYDLVAQVKMDKWSNGRVCLLGDAAYVSLLHEQLRTL
jgi:2-polyprenyl-6-methoxyphenol hydroxylase-like FAD-dependent oxidoreductase